jgi:site-specific recombinase XerD
MMLRNRAILWLLQDTGLQVSDLCGLRLTDVDSEKGVVTVGEKGRGRRTFPLSAESQQAVKQYLEQARLTPSWTPSRQEDREVFLLTERRKALRPNSVSLLFARLNRRAGFSRKPICPSMLRGSYAIGFLQAGGELAALQGQLSVTDLASVRRYQRFCDEQHVETEVQALLEGQSKPPGPGKGSKRTRRKARRREKTGSDLWGQNDKEKL